MGTVRANIQIINANDLALHEHHVIGEEEIRQLEILMLVDTGAAMPSINEEIREALGLPILEMRPSQLADGTRINLPVVGPIKVMFEGRFSMCSALVLPDDNEPLLGAIPMEEMDLWVSPLRQQLTSIHPEGQVMLLSGVR